MSTSDTEQFHGSDLEKIEKVFHIKKEEIVSFSANVNPLGISPALRTVLAENIDSIATYPERDYETLKSSISEYTGAEPKDIMVGNGTTELISLFIDIVSPKKALILGPTYSEYERSISLVGGRTSYYPLKEENDFRLDIDDFCRKITSDLDLIIICNPNNPTSSIIDRDEMRKILDCCKENSVFVMVDETYIEFTENYKKYTAIPLCSIYNNIIVLRSTSKFFACPGLRLGYAISGNEDLYSRIMRYKNPWMIHSLAVVAGNYMFRDREYIDEVYSLVDSERKRMYEKYSSCGIFKVYKPYANFMLLKILPEELSSAGLFERAIHEKMMIRDCSSFPFLSDRFIRICFMNPKDNDRLFECLTRWSAKALVLQKTPGGYQVFQNIVN